MQETLKSVIAQYNASQLLTMREVWDAYVFPWSLRILVQAQLAAHLQSHADLLLIIAGCQQRHQGPVDTARKILQHCAR